jgi:putative oxidoreductase
VFAPILKSDVLMGPLLLIGRLFMLPLFLFYVYHEVVTPGMPAAVLYVGVPIQVVGLAMVVLGYRTRFAALMLAPYCLVTALLFRAHLIFAGPLLTHLYKDLAVVAGFLFLFAYGPGPLSIDRLQGRDAPAPSSGLAGCLVLAGRILCSLVFVFAGQNKIFRTASMQAYMVKHNPHVPTQLIYLAIVTQVVAPAFVLLGYKTRWGALWLSGFCVIACMLFHADWTVHDEYVQFLLDFANAGGLLFLFAYGPGPWSVDARA